MRRAAGCRYLLHDRDSKYTQSFRSIIASGRVGPLVLPARSPEPECLCGALGSVGEGGVPVSKVVLFGERSLRRALGEYVEHYQLSRITRGRTMSCCSRETQAFTRAGLRNAASGWVG
jgi:putative transposase